MRLLACGLVAAVACGGGKSKPKDGGGGSDAAPLFDAPPVAACVPTNGMTMSTRMIGRVTGSAIIATSPPNDGRLFVIQQAGQIRVFDKEQLLPAPFLDVSNIANFAAGGEQGLLGLAFHPNYANNNYFYVWYTTGTACPGSPPATLPCANVLERFTASSTDLNTADPNSGVVILTIPDFATNHNAGMIEFGSDGYLYVSTGDGGAGGDPARNGQNPNALLGKILRLDVDHPANGKMYGIPADNPYSGGGGAPEVYMMGVRNPWRWSFDRANGDMWIADVGQNLYEELDYIPAGQQKGANLGWSMYEANSCYGNYTCSPTGITMPQFVHDHTAGWSAIIGGSVYRGPCYPDLTGYYFFSDYSGQRLMRAHVDSGVVTVTDVTPAAGFGGHAPSSLFHDSRGEIYMTTVDGYVFHLEAGP